jgi:GNAT superfamily N-acetyltransferase
MTDVRSQEAEPGGAKPGPSAVTALSAAPPVDLRLRTMGAEDLPFVVDEHRHHFPDGFFARLGPKFLREYYRAFLTEPGARATIAEVEGEPAGYLVGVTDPAAHRDHVLRRYGRTLVRRALASMLAHPSLAWRFVRTRLGLYARKLLRRRRPAPAGPSGGSSHATAVLTAVAVAPEAQSQGIGSALIDRFEAQVAEAGCDRLALVTAAGDDGAGPYYEHRGWEARGERQTPDGLVLTAYERDVAASGDQDAQPARSSDTA